MISVQTSRMRCLIEQQRNRRARDHEAQVQRAHFAAETARIAMQQEISAWNGQSEQERFMTIFNLTHDDY